MNKKVIQTRIQNKHDLEVNWKKAVGFIPLAGELIIYDKEVDADGNTLELPDDRTTAFTCERFKVGDGKTAVNDLAFALNLSTPDWNQTDETKNDYIKNKPELGVLAYHDEVTKDFLSTDVQGSLDTAAYIDQTENENVENPGVVMTEVVVDAKLSTSSVNPVQNKVITEKINKVEESIDTKTIKGTKITNSDVAYVKDVPENSAGYAKINEIGGMTRKCMNLFDIYDVSVSGTSKYTYQLVGDFKLSSGDYTLSANYVHTGVYNGSIDIREYNNANNNIRQSVIAGGSKGIATLQFTVPDGVEGIRIYVYSNMSGKEAETSINVTDIMINEGTEALPYEPYFEGLRSAPVTEVESVGVNLLDPHKVPETSINGITIKYLENEDCFLINGTATATSQRSYADLKLTLKKNTVYRLLNSYISGTVVRPSGTGYALTYVNYNRPGVTNHNWFSCDCNMGDSNAAGNSYEADTLLGFWFYIDKNVTFDNYKVRVMIYESPTALPYTPYAKHTLTIPAAVQALDGYGCSIDDTLYNYIDFEKKQFVKKIGCVDLGTLAWSENAIPFRVALPDDFEYYSASVPPLLCDKYNVVKTGAAVDWAEYPDKSIGYRTDKLLMIKDSSYTDTASFKAAMSGVMLYYESTTTVTDISHLLPSDSIPVEAGGTITMVNAYGYDVPNTVEFYEGANEIVGADTFVGDLVGTAGRAIADENGNRIDVTAYAPAGLVEYLGGYTSDDDIEALLKNTFNNMDRDTIKHISIQDNYGGIFGGGRVFFEIGKQLGNYGFIKANKYYATSNGIQVAELHKVIYNGNWHAWEWVNPPMIPGVEYRTTERWHGNPVYTKLILCGQMSNYSRVSTGIKKIFKYNAFNYNVSTNEPFNQLPYIETAGHTGEHDCWVAIGSLGDVLFFANSSSDNSYVGVQLWYVK